jgi:hypothetical protein
MGVSNPRKEKNLMEDIEHYERGHTEIAKFRAICGALLLQILKQSNSYQELRNLKAS